MATIATIAALDRAMSRPLRDGLGLRGFGPGGGGQCLGMARWAGRHRRAVRGRPGLREIRSVGASAIRYCVGAAGGGGTGGLT